MSKAELKGRMWRWADVLMEYNMEIIYCPGPKNQVVDTLSRPPINPSQAVTQVEMKLPSGLTGKGPKEEIQGD